MIIILTSARHYSIFIESLAPPSTCLIALAASSFAPSNAVCVSSRYRLPRSIPSRWRWKAMLCATMPRHSFSMKLLVSLYSEYNHRIFSTYSDNALQTINHLVLIYNRKTFPDISDLINDKEFRKFINYRTTYCIYFILFNLTLFMNTSLNTEHYRREKQNYLY